LEGVGLAAAWAGAAQGTFGVRLGVSQKRADGLERFAAIAMNAV
jgi:hypothetical protein